MCARDSSTETLKCSQQMGTSEPNTKENSGHSWDRPRKIDMETMPAKLKRWCCLFATQIKQRDTIFKCTVWLSKQKPTLSKVEMIATRTAHRKKISYSVPVPTYRFRWNTNDYFRFGRDSVWARRSQSWPRNWKSLAVLVARVGSINSYNVRSADCSTPDTRIHHITLPGLSWSHAALRTRTGSTDDGVGIERFPGGLYFHQFISCRGV